MKLKRLIHGTGAAILVAAGLMTGSLASAQELLPAMISAEITPEQAREVAQRAVPGTVLEVERERERGKVIYEVEIRQADGRVFEVVVDAATSAVLEIEAEDDEDDDDAEDEDDGAGDDD